MEPLKWINQPRNHSAVRAIGFENNGPMVLLDETFSMVPAVIPGLKTTLYQHQQTMVAAMKDLEVIRSIKFEEEDAGVAECCAGVLSDPVGSGKTVDILALILLQRFPKARRDITTVEGSNLGIVIRRQFRHILKPTLIFVGISVVDQWVASICQFTDLTYLLVDNVAKLETMLKNIGDLKYDIILVKNGKVTRAVKLPPGIGLDQKNTGKSAHLYNIIANMHDYCWARIIIDDFDTIGLPQNASTINSLFTWYISSTQASRLSRSKTINYELASQLILEKGCSMYDIIDNKLLFRLFNIRNKPEFIITANDMPKIQFFVYQFDDPVGQYAGMLNALNENGREIVEMLNGDSPQTAAERAGIRSTSVADIFERMLGKEYEAYIHSKKMLDFIQQQTAEPFEPLPKEEKGVRIKRTYTRADLLKYTHIKYAYPDIDELLEAAKKEFNEINQKAGLAIQRVKDNLKEGSCPICYNDFCIESQDDIIIFKCCGVVVCNICCFGMIFKNKSMRGTCAKCRRDILIKDIIYVTSNFDTNKIIQDQLEYDTEKKPDPVVDEVDKKEENPAAEVTAEAAAAAAEAAEIENYPPKIKRLLEIIRTTRNLPSGRLMPHLKINNLVQGTRLIPHPETAPRKILVFANYDECLRQIEQHLANKTKIYTLMGSHQHIRNIVEQFRQDTKTSILLINSVQHCSGLNLHFATDLVFMHQIQNKNIESQVLGRGQRIGRTCSMRVHYLLYANEMGLLQQEQPVEPGQAN